MTCHNVDMLSDLSVIGHTVKISIRLVGHVAVVLSYDLSFYDLLALSSPDGQVRQVGGRPDPALPRPVLYEGGEECVRGGEGGVAS